MTLLVPVVSVTGGLNDSQVLQRQTTGTATAAVSGISDLPGRLHYRKDDGSWSEVATLRSHRVQLLKRSRRIVVVVIEHAFEPLSPTDFPARATDLGFGLDESTSEPLMVSLAVVVS